MQQSNNNRAHLEEVAELSDLEQQILSIIKKQPAIALREIAIQVGSNNHVVGRRIRKLQANGTIKKVANLMDMRVSIYVEVTP